MAKLGAIAGESSLHSALGRWRLHINYILTNQSLLGVVKGAENLLNAAGGEIALSGAYGRWARSLSKAVDAGDFVGVLSLLEASTGERGRSATFAWDLFSSDQAGGGVIPVPPPLPFPSFAGLLYRFQINSTANTGSGTAITSATDLSNLGNTIVAGAAGQEFLYQPARYGSAMPGADSVSGWMLTLGASQPVVSFMNGATAATKEFSVSINFQQRVHTASTWWSWSRSTISSRHLTCRTNTSAYVPQIIGGTTSGAQASISAPGATMFNLWHPCPTLYTYSFSGGFDIHDFDGYIDTPIARAWAGTYDVDAFSIGAQYIAAGTSHTNNMLVAEVCVWDHALTLSEKSQLRAYAGTNYEVLGWMENMGATRPARVYAFIGQSNNTGGCVGTQSYSVSAPFTYNLALDGIFKPLTEPSHSATNAVTGTLVWNPAVIGASKALQFANERRAMGETRDIIIVPGALPSSTSASWIVNLATNPPDILSLTGYHKHKVAHALKAPQADLCVLLDQGEADCDSLQETVDWLNNWTAWRAQENTYFSGRFAFTTRHIEVSRLSLLISGVGAFTSQLRTAEDTFASSFSDVGIYQRNQGNCEATPGLHLIASEQQVNGILTAQAIPLS